MRRCGRAETGYGELKDDNSLLGPGPLSQPVAVV